ncbi:MAG: DUF995 domain-containing protein [Proteobacteria bacterium]|nr:DUF995 domain-containing protein [Pseudomonadota bacterium]
MKKILSAIIYGNNGVYAMRISRVIYSIALIELFGCASIEPMTQSQVNDAYSNKTIYYQDGTSEFTKADGMAFYNSKSGLRIGKWSAKNGDVCFKYMDEAKLHCHGVVKKEGKLSSLPPAISTISMIKDGDDDRLEAKGNEKLAREKLRENELAKQEVSNKQQPATKNDGIIRTEKYPNGITGKEMLLETFKFFYGH